jgi:hypothetical protein
MGKKLSLFSQVSLPADFMDAQQLNEGMGEGGAAPRT